MLAICDQLAKHMRNSLGGGGQNRAFAKIGVAAKERVIGTVLKAADHYLPQGHGLERGHGISEDELIHVDVGGRHPGHGLGVRHALNHVEF